jgi:hypothetical protein
VADDIVTRLHCSYNDPACLVCTFCVARAEILWLRAAGDALVSVMQSGSDAGWDAAIDAWREARRG